MISVNRLGNIYGEDRGTGFAGNVWDKNGIAPTITTAQGGLREPLIIEVNNDGKKNISSINAGSEYE